MSEVFPWALLLALLIDAVIGDPGWLYRRAPHPARVMGSAVSWLEARLNRRGSRRARGVLALLLLLAAVWAATRGVEAVTALSPLGWVLEAFVASTLLAQRSLLRHVHAVADGLDRDGLSGGRDAVRHIVGRDPEALDESGVARAAIESCAENASDGVVAPVFWAALFGLPGLALYKAINTADSMIGHRTERYREFGWATARLDDVVNWPAARLCGLLIALAGGVLRLAATQDVPGGVSGGLRAMARDARRHTSTNAGWPEAAMAGVLGLALAGPRRYGEITVEGAWMGRGGGADADARDIRRAVRVTALSFGLLVIGLLALGGIVPS